MKSVLISIQPKWCELIASGKKTVEVRKTKPKLETPFKVYIYETQGRTETPWIDEDGHHIFKGRGQVIGEFVCDEITPLFNVATTSWNLLAGNVHEYAKALVRMARLTEEEMHSYAKRKNCYAWHISDLVIYDKPRELSEFLIDCKCCSKKKIGDPNCWQGCVNGYRRITRAPQSWCYVESEGE